MHLDKKLLCILKHKTHNEFKALVMNVEDSDFISNGSRAALKGYLLILLIRLLLSIHLITIHADVKENWRIFY
jgi:hypothetical protein